jgi:hypothetical protein
LQLSEAGAEAPAPTLEFDANAPPPIDYQRIAYGFSAWGHEAQYHLFFLRRLIDVSLPLDARWLNGYRLLVALRP